jgi:hypothetical protein
LLNGDPIFPISFFDREGIRKVGGFALLADLLSIRAIAMLRG